MTNHFHEPTTSVVKAEARVLRAIGMNDTQNRDQRENSVTVMHQMVAVSFCTIGQ